MRCLSGNHPSPTGAQLWGPVGRCRSLTRGVPVLSGVVLVHPVSVGSAVLPGMPVDAGVTLNESSTPSVWGFLGSERFPMRMIGIGLGRV